MVHMASFLQAVVLFMVVLLRRLNPTQGFPSGAPLSACGHLMPIHEDATAKESASPYLLLLSDTSYTSHQPITLRLVSEQQFLAFMLQGRTKDGRSVGHFSSAPQASKFLTCYSINDTFSHAAAFGRTVMEVVWHPPQEDVGDVLIKGSVAQSKYIFWAVESEYIKGYASVNVTQSINSSTEAAKCTSPLFLTIQLLATLVVYILWS